jgi:signal transduction histidine kinase
MAVQWGDKGSTSSAPPRQRDASRPDDIAVADATRRDDAIGAGRPPTSEANTHPEGKRSDRRGVLSSTRSRMVAAYLVLLVVSGLVTILGIRQVLLVRLENRTQEALNQEILEAEELVMNGSDPLTGQPFSSLERAFDVFMDRNIPSVEEAFVTFLDGELHDDRLRSFPGRELPAEDLAVWAAFSQSDGPAVLQGDFEASRGPAEFRAVRFSLGGETGAFVVTILPRAELRGIEELQTYGGAVIVTIVLLAAICAWFLAGRVLAPVRELTETARSISEADRGARIKVAGTGEAAEMAETFNAMLDRLDAAHQAQIDFVRSAGHELRAPLTVATGHLELLGDDEDERRTVVPLVLDELTRLGRMVDDLQSLAESVRLDYVVPEPVDSELFTHEVVAKASALGQRTWRVGVASPGMFLADRDRLTEAVLNLADNAVNHTGPGDVITISTELHANEVRISVEDTGIGVTPEDAERIFEQFVRGEGAARRYRGAGLGLAIVQTIAEAHDGTMELVSEPGRGARFTMVLPRRT